MGNTRLVVLLWAFVQFFFPQFAQSQEIVGGEKAKRFFERFKNEDRENLNVSLASIAMEGEDGWRYSPEDTLPFGLKNHRVGLSSVGADERGRRYFEQDSTGMDLIGVPNWSMGFWMLPTDFQDRQHSDISPNSFYANRISYLLRMPDEVVTRDGTIIDIRKDPRAYARELGFQRGTYNQHDGAGWFDGNKEDSGWHFYFGADPTWMDKGINLVKVEPLGDDPRFGPNFLRVTFNTQHTTIRTGGLHSRGQFGVTDPELAAFEGDRNTVLRTETRHYLNIGGFSAMRQTDSGQTTPSPFDDGKRMWRFYGASYWYEDDQVDIVGFTDEKPQGTSVVQALVSLQDPQVVEFPVEVRNTGATTAEYVASVAMLENKLPLLKLDGSASGISLHLDGNRNGVLDGDESTQTIGTQKIKVAGKGTERFILRCNLGKLSPSPAELLNSLKQKSTSPLKVIDLNLTVNIADPKDSMSLKGSTVHFIIGLTETKALSTQIERRNIFVTSSPSRFKSYNRAPEAKLRAFKKVGKTLTPLQSGAEIVAGETISFESYGSPADKSASQISHGFYFSDGSSRRARQTGSSVFADYTPWQAGENHFLLAVADGFSRAFDDFSVTVRQAPNVPPVAVIDQPKEGISYPIKQAVFFGTQVGATLTRDPDGGRAGTQRGITKFEWEFGDGSPTSQEQFPAHTYARAGAYRVKLTVTDDEGSRATVERTILIRQENRPPVARLERVSLESFMEFGLVEVTAASSTDPDQSETNNEKLKYFWSVRGPNGITDADLINFTEKSPRYLFVASSPGTYTVSVVVQDRWGAKSSSETSFVVKPWDGVLRINMFSNVAQPGNSYTANDLDPQIPKGWSIGYPGQSSATIGRFGVTEVKGGVGGSKMPVRNEELVNMPANASPLEVGLFSSAVETLYGNGLYTFQNLPAGTYDITAYMYDQENKAPGTEYGIRFNVGEPYKPGLTQIGELKTTLPANPKASDFILKGRLVVPVLGAKSYILVTGRKPDPDPEKQTPETVLDPMRSALSAIELKRVDGPPPPPPAAERAPPRNLRITAQ